MQHVPSGQVLLTPLSFSHRRLPAVVLRWAVYVPMCILVHKGTTPTRLPGGSGGCQQRLLTTLEPPVPPLLLLCLACAGWFRSIPEP